MALPQARDLIILLPPLLCLADVEFGSGLVGPFSMRASEPGSRMLGGLCSRMRQERRAKSSQQDSATLLRLRDNIINFYPVQRFQRFQEGLARAGGGFFLRASCEPLASSCCSSRRRCRTYLRWVYSKTAILVATLVFIRKVFGSLRSSRLAHGAERRPKTYLSQM